MIRRLTAWSLIFLLWAGPLRGAQQLVYADFDDAGSTNAGTEAEPYNSCTNLVANIAAGDHVKIKRTSSRNSETCTFTTAASGVDPIIIEGYLSTPGNLTTAGDGQDDGWNNVFHTSGQWAVGAGYQLKNFDFEGSPSTTSGYLLSSNGSVIWQGTYIRIKNTRTDATVCAVSLDDEGYLENSYIYAPQGSEPNAGCAVAIGDAGVLYGSIVDVTTSGAAGGVLLTHGDVQYQYVLKNTIFGTGNAGKGIYSTTYNDGALGKNRIIRGNNLRNLNVGIEVQDAGTAGRLVLDEVVNNIIWDVNIGIHNEGATSTAGVVIMYNGIGDAATDDCQGWGDQVACNLGFVSLSGDPWNDAANLDYRLNSTAGAGLAVQGTGYPPGLNVSMGAVQEIAPEATRRRAHVTARWPVPQMIQRGRR